MRIIVQIGHYKCGTSALQRRFADHRDLLRAQGLVYPDLGPLLEPDGRDVPSHSMLPFEMLVARGAPGPPWYRQAKQRTPHPPTLEMVRERLLTAIDGAGECDVFISSEEFMRFGESERTEGMVDEFAELIAGHPTTIFCYLRRHDLYLASWYNQLVKMGGQASNLSRTINSYLTGIHVDYAMALRPWVERFGREHFLIRRYEDREGDVSEDVLRHVGIEPAFPRGSAVWENPRFPDLYVETLRRWNQLPMPPRATAELTRLMRREALRGEQAETKVDVLTPGARKLLHARAVEVDVELTELLGLDTSLFPDIDEILRPIPDSIDDFAAHAKWGPGILNELLDAFAQLPAQPADETPPDPAATLEAGPPRRPMDTARSVIDSARAWTARAFRRAERRWKTR